MESTSTSTSNTLFDLHPLPHQQFSSRIAFANNSKENSVTKVKVNSLSKKKSTRLPPIARYDSVCSPPITQERIKYFNRSSESCSSSETIESNNGLDPNLRVKQLEQNLKFVREDCHHILQALHHEIEDLKIKNRDLQNQIIENGLLKPESSQSYNKEQVVIMPLIRGTFETHISEYITKLEKEVKRLRFVLEETLKNNEFLKKEVKKLKVSKQAMDQSIDNPLPSPAIEDFNQTFEAINKSFEFNLNQNSDNLPQITKSFLQKY